MIHRAIAIGILILSMLYLPFWVTGVLSLFAMAYFRWFFESIIVFLYIDMMLGAPLGRFFQIQTALTMAGLVVLFCIEYVKTRLRTYHA